MIIAGLQKLSLVDYPGVVCAVIFTQGCNFRCGYCQNPDLIPSLSSQPQSVCDEQEVFSFLNKRKGMIEGLVITGGEPTLQKDLLDFIRKVKELGLKVKLDTNGANPDLLEKLLKEDIIDYAAVDIKTSSSKYVLVSDDEGVAARLTRTIHLLMLAQIPYEFRTTCVPGVVDAQDFEEIGEIVKGAACYYLQQFRADITLDKKFQTVKPYLPEEIEKFKDILSKYVQRVEIRGV